MTHLTSITRLNCKKIEMHKWMPTRVNPCTQHFCLFYFCFIFRLIQWRNCNLIFLKRPPFFSKTGTLSNFPGGFKLQTKPNFCHEWAQYYKMSIKVQKFEKKQPLSTECTIMNHIIYLNYFISSTRHIKVNVNANAKKAFSWLTINDWLNVEMQYKQHVYMGREW